jgi:thiamine-phosphate pyrophosphorylase
MFCEGLYLITPSGWHQHLLLEALECALRQGVPVVQYREKYLIGKDLYVSAKAVVDLCHRYGTPCIINDNIELAFEIDADGVHLGKGDSSYVLARERLGAQKIIGLSCYGDRSLIRSAAFVKADYVGIGSIFASATKPEAKAIGVDNLASLVSYAKQYDMPVVGIGGIAATNIRDVYKAGVYAAAVISGVFMHDDIAQAVILMSNLKGVSNGG